MIIGVTPGASKAEYCAAAAAEESRAVSVDLAAAVEFNLAGRRSVGLTQEQRRAVLLALIRKNPEMLLEVVWPWIVPALDHYLSVIDGSPQPQAGP